MLDLTSLIGFGAGGAKPPLGKTAAVLYDGSTSTVHSFNNVNLGTEDANRLVALHVWGNSSSATCNGAAMSSYSASNGKVYYLVVPVGTTANFVVTFAASSTCIATCYSLLGLNTLSPIASYSSSGVFGSSKTIAGMNWPADAIITAEGYCTTSGVVSSPLVQDGYNSGSTAGSLITNNAMGGVSVTFTAGNTSFGFDIFVWS